MRRVWMLMPAALILSACGGTSQHKAAAGPPLQTVRISEKEFSLTPSTINLTRAGTYSFAVKNNGTITHAFEVKGNGVEEKTSNISPGSTITLTVDLSKQGDYEVFCPIDGHRSKGMQAKLTVGTSAAPGATTTTTQTTTVPATTTSRGY